MRLGNSANNLIRIAVWGSALVLLVFEGCGLRAVPIYRVDAPPPSAGLPVVDRDDFLSELSLYQGAPYREGGNSIAGIDCSGLVRAVYGTLGVPLRRTVLEQYGQGWAVDRGHTRTGDLLFFGRSGTPTHVGIAISDREMMHSSSSRGVVLEDIDAYVSHSNLIGIRRVADLR
jgi:cell wall-associated NlpC family hydrolase